MKRFCSIVFALLLAGIGLSYAMVVTAVEPTPVPSASPSPLPTPPPTSAPSISVIYQGAGDANFTEVFSEQGSGQCSIRTNTASENATDLVWKATWKVKPVADYSYYPKSSTFTGKSSRTDSDDCGGQPLSCSSDLSFAEAHVPVMKITKSGKKGFLLTISAEEQLDGYNPTASACGQSSVFDNAITDGMNLQNVTEMRIKLTPAKKNIKRKIKFTNTKTFDCTDPAKTISFISNTCTLTMNLSGSLSVNGKWTAKVLK